MPVRNCRTESRRTERHFANAASVGRSESPMESPSIVLHFRSAPERVRLTSQECSFMRPVLSAIAFSLLTLLMHGHSEAGVLFVNNRTGHDRNDGRVDQPIDVATGPVFSISRALALSKPSDSIVIANTGVPYYDALTLAGSRLSGAEFRPLRILGNGAVVTGAMKLPAEAWQPAGKDLFKVVPWRKGHFQLVLDGKAVPELRQTADEKWTKLPDVPEKTWCVWKGAIYYRSEALKDPAKRNFAIARKQCGLTLYHATNVEIHDLTFRHFRLDGINAHDLASNVLLRNVRLIENGRAGLAVGGSSGVVLQNSEISGNRDHSILIQEAGGLSVEGSKLDVPPDVTEPGM